MAAQVTPDRWQRILRAGQASNQAIGVDRVGAGTHPAGQIPGKAHCSEAEGPDDSRVTTRQSTDTNHASRPQASHYETYKRFRPIPG